MISIGGDKLDTSSWDASSMNIINSGISGSEYVPMDNPTFNMKVSELKSIGMINDPDR